MDIMYPAFLFCPSIKHFIRCRYSTKSIDPCQFTESSKLDLDRICLPLVFPRNVSYFHLLSFFFFFFKELLGNKNPSIYMTFFDVLNVAFYKQKICFTLTFLQSELCNLASTCCFAEYFSCKAIAMTSLTSVIFFTFPRGIVVKP